MLRKALGEVRAPPGQEAVDAVPEIGEPFEKLGGDARSAAGFERRRAQPGDVQRAFRHRR